MRSKRVIPREALDSLCLDMRSNPLRLKFCTKPRRHAGRHRYDGAIEGEAVLTKRRVLHVGLPAAIVGLAVGVLVGLVVVLP